MPRLHLIAGDGLRSQFGLTLTFGATALALKAVQVDDELPARIAQLAREIPESSWLAALRRFNVLAALGRAPRADPLALRDPARLSAGRAALPPRSPP